MKTIYHFTWAVLLTLGINAQVPNLEWEANLGGSHFDSGFSIRELSGGGYVGVGFTESNDGDVTGNHGDRDVWMVLLDSNGNLVNQFTYGGSGEDKGNDVLQTQDGGFIIAGYTDSNDGDVGNSLGNGDIWIVKTNASGGIMWEQTFGGSGFEEAQSIQQISSGEYVVVGTSNSTDIGIPNLGAEDIIFLRLNNAGNPELIKLYGGTGQDYGFKVEQTQDGGYIIGGFTSSNDNDVSGNHGDLDAWALKIDGNDNPGIQWQTCVGSSAAERIYDIIQHSNGNYIMVGYQDNSPIIEAYIASLQPDGTFLNSSTYGGSGNEAFYAVDEIANGDYIALGDTSSNDGDVSGNNGSNDIWATGFSPTGTFLWQDCLGGSAQQFGQSIIATSDGGAALCGFSIGAGGDVGGNNGSSDFWIVKLENPLSTYEFHEDGIAIYPNPAQAYFHIGTRLLNTNHVQIKVFNLTGKEIFKTQSLSGHFQVSTSSWSPGIYFVHLVDTMGKNRIEKLIVK